MEKKAISHFTAGIITAAVAIALFFIYYYTGMSFVSNFISIVPYIVTVVLLILFVVLYGRAYHYKVLYGNLFGYGFKATMIFSLLMVAFIYVIFYTLPEYKDKYLDVMKQHMAIDKNMTPEQKELTYNTTSNNFRIIQVGFNLFMNLIAGTLGAVLGATFTRKDVKPASALKE